MPVVGHRPPRASCRISRAPARRSLAGRRRWWPSWTSPPRPAAWNGGPIEGAPAVAARRGRSPSEIRKYSRAVRVLVCCCPGVPRPFGEEGLGFGGDLEGLRVGIWWRVRGCATLRVKPELGHHGARQSWNELQLHDIDRAKAMRSSSAMPCGACVEKKSRCSFENNLRIGRSPASTPRTACGPHCALSDAEHTNPPGMASTSTPNCFDLRAWRELIRDHRPQLHDRVVAFALDPPGPNDEAVLVDVRSGVSKNTTWRICASSASRSSDAAAERWSDSGTVSFSSTVSAP